jgi:hypothetical protein
MHRADFLWTIQYATSGETRIRISRLVIAPLRLENTTEPVAAKPAINKVVTADGNCTLHCRRDLLAGFYPHWALAGKLSPILS